MKACVGLFPALRNETLLVEEAQLPPYTMSNLKRFSVGTEDSCCCAARACPALTAHTISDKMVLQSIELDLRRSRPVTGMAHIVMIGRSVLLPV